MIKQLCQAARWRLLLLLLPLLAASGRGYAENCESLSRLTLPHTVITAAQLVPAGSFSPSQSGAGSASNSGVFSQLPAFCRVTAVSTPVSGSQITIEVWMPESGWNGKLQSVGNGAFAGYISYPALAAAVLAGYASASTDTGHTGNSASFISDHPEKLTDFAYRAVHEMTLAAKSIISALYGAPIEEAYFNGCSTGGRQALTEAQRYPSDYDGIISGAPASYTTHMAIGQLWIGSAVQKDSTSYIPQEKFVLLHEGALAACDHMDGVKDGVIEDPPSCHFDPVVLACKQGDASSCLTAPQVAAARKIYSGAVNPRSGLRIFPGLEPGSELGWGTFLAGRQPFSYAADTLKYEVFKDAKWDPLSLNFDSDVDIADRVAGGLMNATDANLHPFLAHGGKLLLYHGWSDPGIPPLNTVNYYESVLKTMGKSATDSVRLFMVPGMGHCAGGNGTDDFDKVVTLDRWVTQGKAPEQILATHKRDGVVTRSRPLCPYPQQATYKGSGNTDDAANFLCQAVH